MIRHLRGLSYMALSKAKYLASNYTPKPITDLDSCIDYDFGVVELWERYAAEHFPDYTLEGKTVVEAGPGSDLGIATILLAKGMRKYYGFDVHDLVAKVQPEFYERLVKKIAEKYKLDDAQCTDLLRAAASYSRNGDGRINYVCKGCVDFGELADGEVDVVFSQAALEHFQDPHGAFALLSPKCKSGAILVAEVDLKAHSRWVREHDPLCIYLYDDVIYRLFSHKASPNRVRPREYAAMLEENGWVDVRIVPIRTADESYLQSIRGSVRERFRDEHLGYLSIMLLARKR